MGIVLDAVMKNLRLAVLPLRAVLALLFAILVLLQVMSLPGQFEHMARESPELAYLRWPLTALTVLMVACVQVVVVCIWRLLTMVRDDRIFSERSFVFVDAIVGAIAVGWLLLFGVFLLVLREGGPGEGVLLTLMLLGAAVLALLMVVMRALLWQATTLRSDMDLVL